MIDLSIVVVNWNTRALLLECLASIEGETRASNDGLHVETLVVDNGSVDGSVAAVAARFPWAHRITLPRNLGFATGANRGLAAARGRHALLLNSDARLAPGVLAHCVGHLDAHPAVGIVGPQLLHPDGRPRRSVHNAPGLVSELLPPGLLQRLFPRRFPSWRRVGSEPVAVEAVAGAALFLRMELLDRVGPLPEQYFCFLEETDWCGRVRRAGWRVEHLPTATVFHLSGGSSQRKAPARTRIEYHRSLYRFFREHRGRALMGTVLLLRVGRALVQVVTRAPLALLGGRHRTRWAVHREVLLWHLRGCPAREGLAGAAALASEGRR